MNKFCIILCICFFISCGADKQAQKTPEQIEINISELKDESVANLRFKRNEIFARKGYIFNSEDLRKHFSTFDWYKPKYTNVDTLLTELDKQNIQVLLELEKIKKEKIERRMIRLSEKEISEFRNVYDSAKKWEKHVLDKMFHLIDQFRDRPADTTILIIGNIDGFGSLDTIQSHIYSLDDTAIVESSWYRNGELLWSETQKNPIFGLYNGNIFIENQRHPWVNFTIAVNFCAPELRDRAEFTHIDRNSVISVAMREIKKQNLNISKVNYTQYFDSFNGQLFVKGEPEFRELMMWYEPEKMFITYYAE